MDLFWTLDIAKFDKETLPDFLAAHQMAHDSVYTTLLSLGVSPTHFPLGDLDEKHWDDWLYIHAMEHSSFSASTGIPVGFDIARMDPHNPEDVSSWITNHTFLHQLYNQQLGL